MTAHHSSRERMTAADAAWYRMGTRNSPADILAMMWLDGEVDCTQLITRIQARLRPHIRFRQRVVHSLSDTAPPHWEDETEADAATHFEVRRAAEPGGDAELLALLNELINEPLPSNASPWRMYVIEGLRAGTVVFARLQHCMGDGFALVRVVFSLADEEHVLQASPAWKPSTHGFAKKNALDWLRRMPRIGKSLAHLLELSFDPPTRFRGPLCGRRELAWSQALDLDSLRALAHARNVTINDALMSIATGALRAYLDEHDAEPCSFRALVPVNLRPTGTMPETTGNWFGLVYVDLPIDVDDHERRLAAVKSAFDRIKASEEALVSLGVMRLMGWLPPILERLFQMLFARKGTLVISNVAGPVRAIHMLGHRVREMMFWPPHPGELACGIGIMSYAGVIRVGVRSDLAVIDDPGRVTALFDQELRTFAPVRATDAAAAARRLESYG